MLEELAGGETAAVMDAAFSAVASKQFDPFVVKLVETLGATFHTLTVNKDAGLGRLHALAHAHAHSPQIAGALFFVQRHGTDKIRRFVRPLLRGAVREVRDADRRHGRTVLLDLDPETPRIIRWLEVEAHALEILGFARQAA